LQFAVAMDSRFRGNDGARRSMLARMAGR